MIDFATAEMLPAIRKIWIACFGDDSVYTDLVFEKLLRPERILTMTDGGEDPVAILCIEPFSLTAPTAGKEAKAAYVYGVATHPDHQGKGLSTQLLNHCHEYLSREGYHLSALVPAGESLFQFYGKRGYETAFSLRKAEFQPEDLPVPEGAWEVRAATLDEFTELRDRHFGDRAPLARWNRDYLRYIAEESATIGGGVLRLAAGEDVGYAVCYREKETVTVKELAMPESRLLEGVACLHERFQAEKYRIYLPQDVLGDGQIGRGLSNKVLPFAMVRWYDRRKQEEMSGVKGLAGWLTHALD